MDLPENGSVLVISSGGECHAVSCTQANMTHNATARRVLARTGTRVRGTFGLQASPIHSAILSDYVLFIIVASTDPASVCDRFSRSHSQRRTQRVGRIPVSTKQKSI